MGIVSKAKIGVRLLRDRSVLEVGYLVREKLMVSLSSIPLLDDYWYSKSVEHLRNLQKDEGSVRSVLNTTRKFEGYGPYHTIKPLQHKNRILSLAKLISDETQTQLLK